MSFTILSARWGNVDHTSAVINTVEAATVVISQADTPREWTPFVTWAAGNTVATEFVRIPPTKQQMFDRWISSLGMTAAEFKAFLG